jgi:phosphotriesterase-related protein
VATVATLCERGYANQLVLSHDAYCFGDWTDHEVTVANAPNWHYRFIPDVVLGDLRARGVTDGQLDEMLVQVPRRILAGS